MLLNQLCDFIGNVLRSHEDALSGPPTALFSCAACRRETYRLQVAIRRLGPKPVACIGSILRLLQEMLYV